MAKLGKYDIIIIGSGIGGLMLGALLSKEKKVLLLEKNNNFGGYCAKFRRNGFTFEVAIEAINGLKKDETIYDLFKKSGVLDKSSFVRPPHIYRSIYPDYDLRFPQGDIHKYKELLYSLFYEEKRGIDNLLNEIELIFKEVDILDKKKKLVRSPNLLKYNPITFGELLNAHIKDERLKAIISQYWVYRGLPPNKLSSITFSYIWYDYTFNGSYYPKEGMGKLSNECVNIINKNGSSAIKNAGVTSIYNRGDKVIEIELADKRRFSADIFVSNMDVRKTFDMLTKKNDLVNGYIRKLSSKDVSISAFKVYLGLNVSLKKLGITDYEVFINPSYDLDKMYHASVKNKVDEAPMAITLYSNITDCFCDANSSVVTLTMLSGYDFWKNMDRVTYERTKERITNALIKRAECIIPNLKVYIKTKVAATPLTMERHTGNSNGAIYGWSKGNLYDEIKFMKASTPIKNLFLSSQWTKIGGGVAGVMRIAERVYRTLATTDKAKLHNHVSVKSG